MENREIIVANTKTQKRNKIVTNATTLAELKAAFDNAGIDYAGMTFTEGISKIQLLDDATQLPQNVMYKGQPTNNLVILLTNTKKNIASGISAADRKAAYSIIKEFNLQKEIEEFFGRNFTQVPTSDLQEFIEDRTENDAANDEDDEDDEDYGNYDEEDDEDDVDFTETVGREIADSIIASIDHLEAIGKLLPKDIGHIIDSLMNKSLVKSEPVETSDGSINDDDVDNMLDELNI